MELKELTDKTLKLFKVKNTKELLSAIEKSYNNNDIMQQFCDLVNNDLSVDWLQKIYQYYEADRKDKKQDYTPASLADLMAKIALSESNEVVDMCAGSGALTIAAWRGNPKVKATCIEFDQNVIPILVFNLAIRNIRAKVIRADVLTREKFEEYRITRGEKFGKVEKYGNSN
ncbi:MAG: hypothetical protein [Bacteriophage sp.]|nr:MAG: hypothetical protein [Bacteriophage sp.]